MGRLAILLGFVVLYCHQVVVATDETVTGSLTVEGNTVLGNNAVADIDEHGQQILPQDVSVLRCICHDNQKN